MTVLFEEPVAAVFDELPEQTKRQAAESMNLLAVRGRGYRYFVAGRHLFYFSISGAEIRLSAIIPAAMKRARPFASSSGDEPSFRAIWIVPSMSP